MTLIDDLLHNNQDWAKGLQENNADLLREMEQGQDPKLLWLGCSDSRVLAINSLGLGPGDIFVHRNIANQARLDDPSCQSVLQFATSALNIEHILVCGHYGCGGVQAALADKTLGADLDVCLLDLKQLCKEKAGNAEHNAELEKQMVEENVRHQVKQVALSPHLKRAWQEGRNISIHGLVFDVASGEIHNLDCSISGPLEQE